METFLPTNLVQHSEAVHLGLAEEGKGLLRYSKLDLCDIRKIDLFIVSDLVQVIIVSSKEVGSLGENEDNIQSLLAGVPGDKVSVYQTPASNDLIILLCDLLLAILYDSLHMVRITRAVNIINVLFICLK